MEVVFTLISFFFVGGEECYWSGWGITVMFLIIFTNDYLVSLRSLYPPPNAKKVGIFPSLPNMEREAEVL